MLQAGQATVVYLIIRNPCFISSRSLLYKCTAIRAVANIDESELGYTLEDMRR